MYALLKKDKIKFIKINYEDANKLNKNHISRIISEMISDFPR